MDYGWKGEQVRNKDGRRGLVQGETAVGPMLTLHIRVEDGSTARVVLNADSRDGGETGWEWFCKDFSGGARWLTLGDHN